MDKIYNSGISPIGSDELSKEEIYESAKYAAQEYIDQIKLEYTTKGMSEVEWEELFCERDKRDWLREYRVSEALATDVVALTIQAVVERGIDVRKVEMYCISSDKYDRAMCTMCPREPFRALMCMLGDINKEGSAIVTLLCKEHFFRIVIDHDKEFLAAVEETVKRRRARDLSNQV